ncbi:MAG TPA: hypothetical protein VE053_12485 [Allosphingosinicella sp.]|nr:hypothetical protein [Allosphingosinicella sp.]
MTIGGIISIAFLAVMVVLILRGVRGHGHGDKSDSTPDDRLDEVGGGGDD